MRWETVFGFCHHSENDSCDDVGSCASDYYLSGGESAEKTSAERTEVSEDCSALVCIGFMGVIAFNSFDLLPAQLVAGINTLDTFLLTMAMTALGTETSIDKFRKAGAKPFVLALLLYVWLVVGGYFLVKYLTPYLM